MKCSILYNPFSVPTTPDNFIVCAVYDKVNGTLQITETTWNELVCCVCRLLPSCTLHKATQSSFPVSGCMGQFSLFPLWSQEKSWWPGHFFIFK